MYFLIVIIFTFIVIHDSNMLDFLLHKNINKNINKRIKKVQYYFLDLLKLQWVSLILNNVMLG